MAIDTMTITNILKTVLIVDIVLIFCLLLWAEATTVLNTQVSFISFSLILLVSYLSYKNHIDRSVANYDGSLAVDDDDDKFELYKYKKKPGKIDNIKQTIKNRYDNLGRFVSVYRIVSYALFVLGFFALKEQNILQPIAYLVGISVLPVGIIVHMGISKVINYKQI